MSKRRHPLRDHQTLRFSPSSTFKVLDHEPETHDDDLDMDFAADNYEPGDLLNEAHDALSKLFTKTNKRAKQLRGVRRKDAWQ